MSLNGSITKEQPEPISGLSTHPELDTPSSSLHARASKLRRKVTTRNGWFGDYNYAWLCTPTLPFHFGKSKPRRRMPPFYALDSDLPLLLAMTCGLQHALAMLAGLITPPIIFANALSLDAATGAYMISASLIGCGMYPAKASRIEHQYIPLFRYLESGTDVKNTVMARLLPWYRTYYRRWNQFRYSKYRQRRTPFKFTFLSFLTHLPDFQRYVRRWYMSYDHRCGRDRHPRTVPRRLRKGSR